MEPVATFLIVFYIATVCNTGFGNRQSTFNVVDFGAKGDGTTDDSAAFTKAWEALCGATGDQPTLEIPSGRTFLLKPVIFQGPCKSNSVHVQVSGTIVAPKTTAAWGSCGIDCWLSFSDIGGLVLDGSGTIDGQGSIWWQNEKCTPAKALQFHKCDNLHLRGLTHLNSPRTHIGINDCTGVFLSNLNITAPENSPNTDGIDISQSTQVQIQSSFIGTGDDCIAICGNSSNINVTNIACGPGHGISIGSLGKDGAHDKVEEVHVRNCTFSGTQNGARIKTWQGGSGYARKISFDQITLIASQNPILIDQYYCNGGHDCQNSSSAVKVSDITYTGFQGTSADPDQEAIRLDCSGATGCNNIIMDQINIISSVSGKQTHAYCNNANGTSKSTVPVVSCLRGSGLVRTHQPRFFRKYFH